MFVERPRVDAIWSSMEPHKNNMEDTNELMFGEGPSVGAIRSYMEWWVSWSHEDQDKRKHSRNSYVRVYDFIHMHDPIPSSN